MLITAIDDFEPLEFSWCPNPTPATPRTALRGVTLAGNLLVLCFVLGLGTWSSFAPLESAAIASGVVEPESSRKTIQHLEGGIVRNILVSDGDIVHSGQTLITLDDTRARAEVESLRAQLWDAMAREARLLADAPLGRSGSVIRGHEFHYASLIETGNDAPLVDLADSGRTSLGRAGGRRHNVSGTFFHTIARN